MNRRVWIHTFGCQMNDNDTEKMYRILGGLHYSAAAGPEDADLVILNTCAIREKAEQKMFSSLGRLRRVKQRRPGMVIGVAGCVAQLLGAQIRQRAPFVDLVFGTHSIHKLPELINRTVVDRQAVAVEMVSAKTPEDFDFLALKPGETRDPIGGLNRVSRHVTIQNGCNKNCSYCVVPATRGREISRPAVEILEEVRLLADQGVSEVTLLGQTVNSYGKGGDTPFPQLLRAVNRIDGIRRIRFVTSHPRDLDDTLIAAMAECDKVCEALHLPVQSGSDRILKMMYRGYTAARYLERVEALRARIPTISLSTDIIVGFPSESDADFEKTLELLRQVRFDTLFSFVYSTRPNTLATTWDAQIPNEIARARLNRLQKLQAGFSAAALQREVGCRVEVLVEGRNINRRNGQPLVQWRGRTRTHKMVHFHLADSTLDLTGKLVTVEIEQALSHTLNGRLLPARTRRSDVH